MAEIITYSNPNVILDEIFIPDNESNVEEGVKASELEGTVKPTISINSMILQNIDSFSIDCSGFYPVLNFTFKDSNDDFAHLFFPKDGDIISVYIKSNNPKRYKNIRVDFNIAEMTSYKQSFTVRGIIRLNGLTTESINAYRNNSFNVLKDVASELNLGYSSNVALTNDNMTWINANDSKLRFVEDVTRHSWIDEDSFMTSFIDIHYYLNMVDVSRQFKDMPLLDKTYLTFNDNIEIYKDENSNFENGVDLILSNHPKLTGTSMYILNWELFNNSHQVNFNHGYIKNAIWFDSNARAVDARAVDAITTIGSESNKQLMKGRPGDSSYASHIKNRYMGMHLFSEDLTGNVHSNYAFAELHNMHNNINAAKIGIKITMEGINGHLYRYQTIPVIIYDINQSRIESHIIRDKAVDEYDKDGAEEEATMKENKILSGFYVIRDIKYVWDSAKSNIGMELMLIRREWPLQFPKNMVGRKNG